MPSNLANFFNNRGYLADVQNYTFSGTDLAIARNAMQSDIDAYYINGLISLASALTSLKKESYSWAFIQSYYTLFYFARAYNGINDYAIVYSGTTPYGIKIQPSESFKKLKGNSHDVVLNQFKSHLSSDVLLSNTIESLSPVDWFNRNRNDINYKISPQTDPNPPLHLYSYKTEIRKWIITYLSDKAHVYTFDPSHCYLAYPLQLFEKIYKYYVDNGLSNSCLDEGKIDFFKKGFSDDKGTLAPILTKIHELIG